MRTFIERVPTLTPHYGKLKELTAEGWVVQALRELQKPHSIVLLGYLPEHLVSHSSPQPIDVPEGREQDAEQEPGDDPDLD